MLPQHPFPVCNILGVNIAVTNMKKTVDYLDTNLKALSGSYICVSNVHTTVMSYEDESYRSVQNGAAVALPDGKPLSVACRKRGFAEAERVTGPDLMREIFSFFTIPWISRHLNFYSCIAPAGATSEDTTLPMMIRYTNEETVVISVFNGVICSAAVPVLIAFCYHFFQ